MAARAAAQALGQEEQEKQKKKKASELDFRFAQFMKPHLEVPKVSEAEIKKFEDMAIAKKAHGPDWRGFLKTVLTAEIPTGERMSMDDLIKLALQRPIPVKKAPEGARIREMVAVKSPGFDYKPGAVTAAVDLGILLETRKKLNFKKDWVGKEAVA